MPDASLRPVAQHLQREKTMISQTHLRETTRIETEREREREREGERDYINPENEKDRSTRT